jgi:hypothetical protein
MTPITLFDKSFLQGLSLHESVFFDQFFMSVVCPIFHVETLADLAKSVREGRTPEQEVGFIADKTPELHIAICSNHVLVSVNSFLGRDMVMDGRVPRSFGRRVRVHGRPGVVYEPSDEEIAFTRWQNHQFSDVEHHFAKRWREHLTRDSSMVRQALEVMGVRFGDCKTLADAKAMAEAFVASTNSPRDRINIAKVVLGFSYNLEDKIYGRWKDAGFPSLPTFARYGAYSFTVAVFLHIAIGAELLVEGDKMDISYLYYLPFCNLFVSSDKLHRRSAPLFMREDQRFVWGQDLKANLKQIAEHYMSKSEEERERGLFELAPAPPSEAEGLVAELYDQYGGENWRDRRNRPPIDQTRHPEVMQALQRMSEAPTEPDDPDNDEEVEMLRIDRHIRRKRGNFYTVRKDTPDVPIP